MYFKHRTLTFTATKYDLYFVPWLKVNFSCIHPRTELICVSPSNRIFSPSRKMLLRALWKNCVRLSVGQPVERPCTSRGLLSPFHPCLHFHKTRRLGTSTGNSSRLALQGLSYRLELGSPRTLCLLPVRHSLLRKCLPPKRRWTCSLVGYDTVPSESWRQMVAKSRWTPAKGYKWGSWIDINSKTARARKFRLLPYSMCSLLQCNHEIFAENFTFSLDWDSQDF
jgi:hypothetical protein